MSPVVEPLRNTTGCLMFRLQSINIRFESLGTRNGCRGFQLLKLLHYASKIKPNITTTIASNAAPSRHKTGHKTTHSNSAIRNNTTSNISHSFGGALRFVKSFSHHFSGRKPFLRSISVTRYQPQNQIPSPISEALINNWQLLIRRILKEYPVATHFH